MEFKQISVQILFTFLIINVVFSQAQFYRSNMVERRRRMMQRRIIIQNKLKPKVCYDFVGCFADPPPNLSLKRPPDHPDKINTRFLLYTRNQSNVPELLTYGDDMKSMKSSNFNGNNNVKVIVHGYKGNGSDKSIIVGTNAILQLEDANVIVLDWSGGAGSSYGSAVANTELVGRQLSLVLMDTIRVGSSPQNWHIIGFSLGAHVAGCASEMLKKKNLLIERITGLDPASPFFKNHLIRQRSKKLDISDARFVDIIHTDGSETLTDGFGLLKPMGHVDFFPNGGREQPGCNDVKNSVVVSHLSENTLDKSIVCSHLRAWRFFVESIKSQLSECKFVAWPCTEAAVDYLSGNCFPKAISLPQEMGYKTNFDNQGIFYLATKAEEPYCGEALRAQVTTSAYVNSHTSGILYLDIEVGGTSTSFKIRCDIRDNSRGKLNFFNIAAGSFEIFGGTSSPDVIQGFMEYLIIDENKNETGSTTKPFHPTLNIDSVIVEDRTGKRWEYHGGNIPVGDTEQVNIQLRGTN